MSQNAISAAEFHDAALRMIAASEHFKVAGELPSWARADLESWSDSEALAPARRSPVLAAS